MLLNAGVKTRQTFQAGGPPGLLLVDGAADSFTATKL